MKLRAQRESLLAAFQTAASVAPARSPMPILQNVKLDAKKDAVELSATDTEIGVRVIVPNVDVQQAGVAVLNVSRFGSILREATDESLHIESAAQLTVIKGDRSQYRLPAVNADEFPAVPGFTETKYFEINARLLKEMVRRTLFATDSESGRYALGGVLFEFGANKLSAVSTDGRRLAKMEGPVTAHGGAAASEAQTIVPARALQLVDRAFADSEGEIQVAVRANDILFRSARCTIYCRLLEGRFPRWKDVVPKAASPVLMDLQVGPLFAAVRQAAIVSSEETKGLDFTFGEGTLLLAGSAADVGESKVELPIPYTGSPITITLNHKFVADFLKVFDPTRTVSVGLSEGDGPAVITTDDGYVYVIMPLNRGQ